MNHVHLLFLLRGRIARWQFWLGIVLTLVIAALVGFGFAGAAGSLSGVVLLSAAMIAIVYMQVAVMVKRFHDRDRSGYWALLWVVPQILREALSFTNIPDRDMFESIANITALSPV